MGSSGLHSGWVATSPRHAALGNRNFSLESALFYGCSFPWQMSPVLTSTLQLRNHIHSSTQWPLRPCLTLPHTAWPQLLSVNCRAKIYNPLNLASFTDFKTGNQWTTVPSSASSRQSGFLDHSDLSFYVLPRCKACRQLLPKNQEPVLFRLSSFG